MLEGLWPNQVLTGLVRMCALTSTFVHVHRINAHGHQTVTRTPERPKQGWRDPAREPARGLYSSERLDDGPPEVVGERADPQVQRHRLEATKTGQGRWRAC